MAQAGYAAMRAPRVRAWLLTGLLALVSLAFATSASAKLSGNYARFASCPYKDPEASKCIYSTTEGGEVVLGARRVPIINPVVLQGAYAEEDKAGFSKLIAATNGVTLSKVPQPLPGGLAGIVPSKQSPPLVKAAIAFFFENAFTAVSATLELAGPASEIRLSEGNLSGEIATALRLPVKIHLENPFLGPDCYIGSQSSPIVWNLSSGTTHPRSGEPIAGTVGEAEFLEGGSMLETKGTILVDDAWQAPAASGCGGFLSFLINPILNSTAGLPSAPGESLVRLENSAFITAAAALKINEAESP